MAYTSSTFSGAISSPYAGETATTSTYRHTMCHQASRRLYNYRLNTYEPQNLCGSASSHLRAASRTDASTHQHATTSQRASTHHHPASPQHTAPPSRVAPPRRHGGVLLPEASAAQHQAVYLEYLRVVAAGRMQDPTTPPNYDNYDDEATSQVPPPSYEQAVDEAANDVLEPAIVPRTINNRGTSVDAEVMEELRYPNYSASTTARGHERRFGPLMLASLKTARKTPKPAIHAAPPVQALQLIQVDTPAPTALPPRQKSSRLLSKISNKLRLLKAA